MVKNFGHFFLLIFIGLYKPAGYIFTTKYFNLRGILFNEIMEYTSIYHPLSYPLRFWNMYSYKRAQKTIFIGSAISEILRVQTDTHTHADILLLLYKDITF